VPRRFGEDGGVGRIELVGAEDAPDGDVVDGKVFREQGADLDRRRMSTKKQVAVDRLDEEGVLHCARRVVGVEVERVEVEPLVFELRALGKLPPHADEDVGHFLLQEAQRMARALATPARQSRDVDALGLEPRRLFGDGQLLLACSDGLVDPAAGAAHQLACRSLLIVRKIAKTGVHASQRRGLADVLTPHSLELGDRLGGVDRCESGFDSARHGGVGDG
jgi:hypothetical protein